MATAAAAASPSRLDITSPRQNRAAMLIFLIAFHPPPPPPSSCPLPTYPIPVPVPTRRLFLLLLFISFPRFHHSRNSTEHAPGNTAGSPIYAISHFPQQLQCCRCWSPFPVQQWVSLLALFLVAKEIYIDIQGINHHPCAMSCLSLFVCLSVCRSVCS